MVIGRLHSLVVDCAEPRALAGFYAELLGGFRVYADPAGHPFCPVTPQSVPWTAA
jgi:hypothetical protein